MFFKITLHIILYIYANVKSFFQISFKMTIKDLNIYSTSGNPRDARRNLPV